MTNLLIYFGNRKRFPVIFFALFELLFFSSPVFAQQNTTIRGKVIDERTEEAIIGANISLKSEKGNQGISSDTNGNFELKVSSLPTTIVVSYLGYKPQEIDIYEKTEERINIPLLEDFNRLNEVVIVSDGYYAQERKQYTGASTVITGAINANKPVSSPLISLQGAVSGLNISIPSSQPGASPEVLLRGLGSLALSSSPLYVIDGMITSSDALTALNQDDIEDITVLKDAAATAIYGSRGSNGIIIITTKKGKAGKTQVNFDIEVGNTNIIPFPDAGQPLNAQQYSELFIEGLRNAGTYSEQDIADLSESYGFNSGRSNNWQDLVYKTGQQQQYNVSVRSGNENTKLFVSAGYFTQEATTLKSDLRKISGLINLEQKIGKRFTLTAGLNIANLFQHTPDSGTGSWGNPIFAARILRPFQMAYNEDGTYNTNSSSNLGYVAHYNVLFIAENDIRSQDQTRGRGNISLKWNIWDRLNYTGYASLDYNNSESFQFLNPVLGGGMNAQGSASQTYSRTSNWLTRNQLDYRYNFLGNEDSSYITAIVGYEAQQSGQLSLSGSGTGFPLTQPSLIVLSNAATITGASSSNSGYAFSSVYSRIGTNYKDKYSISGSFRRDGSSVFGANNRYGSFWSVGGAWNIDEEDFFTKQKIFSSARFHTSYGTTGNAQGISNYAAMPQSSYGSNYTNGNGQNYGTIGNPDLTWEKQKKFDIGADFGFFNNRLIITPDFYVNNIDGLIQSVSLSRTTGFSSVPYANSGAMQNRGLELTLRADILRTKKFSWTSNFNISFNKNEVTELGKASGANGNYYLDKGYDYYTYYTRLYAGVNPDDGTALWYTNGTRSETTTDYNAAERVPYRSASPKYFGGFTNTFEYKGISLSGDIYFNFGNYVIDSWSTRFYDGAYYTFNKYQREYWNRWTSPGQITDVPKYIAAGGAQANSNSFSSRFLYDGSFIRLKNVTIGYDLIKLRSIKHLIPGVGKLRLYGRATNLFTKTFDEKLPFDPESGNVSIPIYRIYTVGLSVEL
ncbi:MAG: SusC/RagA family TonB-linked outer membrane protein [Candidatus Symbiothrix sp.]|jgi:TonB-linked SusC/RagA family outer membrane protein|nr:SusC/RagA family TonB-linked outer membrane protein [Candidatus Symbiothrix sp.]